MKRQYRYVWRLEHGTCKGYNNEFTRGHGPASGISDRCDTRWFGWVGKPPTRVVPHIEFCGVVKRQLPYWWNESIDATDTHHFQRVCQELANNGWQFVMYTVPTDLCRIDRKQVIFRKEDAVAVAKIPWSKVPGPAHCDRLAYHGRA